MSDTIDLNDLVRGKDDPMNALVPPPRNPMMDSQAARFAGSVGAGVLTDLLSSLATLPKRMMQSSAERVEGGDFDPAPTAEFMLDAATMGIPTAPKGAVGVFGGKLAATADKAALAKAEEMAAKGASREDILTQTGWFQGGDGKWRFEIPDSGAKFRYPEQTEMKNWKLGDALDHSQLFEAYPWLRNMKVSTNPKTDNAYFLGSPVSKERGRMSLGAESGAPDMGTALHEIQHAVQRREGFPEGSSVQNELPWWNLKPSSQSFRDATDRYLLSPGEIEANNVAGRFDNGSANKSPWETEPKPATFAEIARMKEDYAAKKRAYDDMLSKKDSPRIAELESRMGDTKNPLSTDELVEYIGHLTKDTPRGASASIRAYHGSPYDFDRFDLSKIGTGEGAAAYGHGIYVAENPAVAQEYRDRLAASRGKLPDDILSLPPDMRQAVMAHTGTDADALTAAKRAQYMSSNLRSVDLPKVADMVERAREAKRGRMYEVNINAHPDQFLDWDKPLSGQPSFQDIFQQSGVHTSYAGPMGTRVEGNSPIGELAGQRLKEPGSLLNKNLREAGIPGIKYLDQGSRAVDPDIIPGLIASIKKREAGAHPNNNVGDLRALEEDKARLAQMLSPTSNYVVFDDKLIDILRKYGIAGLSMLPPALAAELQSKITPVEHDPFANPGLTPVEHDPFVQ